MLITGASEGIGTACARALRARGARLVLHGRSLEKLNAIATRDDLVIAADLTAKDAAPMIMERTLSRFGRLDILINNAGRGIYWPVAASPDRETRDLFDLNLFAPLALCQAAIPIFRKQGGGSIVNVGSIAGNVALPWMPLYSASKSALASVTEALRMELASDHVHVTLVLPGYILTRFHEHSLGLAPPPRVISAKQFAITPERCAEQIVRGIERRARRVVTPRWGWLFLASHALFPRSVEARLLQLNHSAGNV